ncbi:MAG: hypothetical protein RIF41_26385 [Polyangiaceae bacterium]
MAGADRALTRTEELMPSPFSKPPVIPQPPPRVGGTRKRQSADRRALVGVIALALGATLGALGYEWIPGITVSFDYLLMLVAG